MTKSQVARRGRTTTHVQHRAHSAQASHPPSRQRVSASHAEAEEVKPLMVEQEPDMTEQGQEQREPKQEQEPEAPPAPPKVEPVVGAELTEPNAPSDPKSPPVHRAPGDPESKT